MSTRLPHLGVFPEQVSERVIVCGEPARVNRIAEFLDSPKLLGENREYRLMTGHYQGHRITVCSTGIGAPSAVIALEELKPCGVRFIIRVGSAGALQASLNLGDLVVAEAAVRDEGASRAYVSPEFPACASHRLVAGLRAMAEAGNYPVSYGVVRSHDGFYRDDEMAVCDYWSQKGVLAADMETAALYTVGRLRGIDVAAILNTVVLYQQDVQEGVVDYAESDKQMMAGEKKAIQFALAVVAQE